jgi:hypothetical protein
MRPLAALFLAAAALTSGLRAGLVSSLSAVPATLSQGQDLSVQLSVVNSDTVTAAVSPTLGWIDNGFGPVLLQGPGTLPESVPAKSSAAFTWVFKAGGCGGVVFSASASAAPDAGPETSGTVTAESEALCGSASPGPPMGSAAILGNVFHPLDGGTLVLKFVEPYAGAVDIDLFDRLGRQVQHLAVSAEPGTTLLPWDGRGSDGTVVPSGIYEAYFHGKGLNSLVKFAVIK